MSSARPTQDLIAGSRAPERHQRKNPGPLVRTARRAAQAVLAAALAVGAPLLVAQPANAVTGLVTAPAAAEAGAAPRTAPDLPVAYVSYGGFAGEVSSESASHAPTALSASGSSDQ